MEYIRKIIDSDILEKIINIPEELKHKKVEIIILPASNANDEDGIKKKKSLLGVFEEDANPYLIEKENKAWRNAVSEKYEDN
ncbi:hypothetical protein C8C77_11259 [Halanaerobium saccharolyticum]|uniref:Uncharacterized protein n=1 Tax=Halanaerobium saccharolyticum TaxID=43595 RepID=A0A4R7Z395_9FIRM|nr:hypothetical protein [Halanaerobium saccharolyticum]RAK08440.1 hypothetical protein C7958_11017 [Halanaerobium saccharolyticum]TDW03525.1 hypothetical protein C8C77_11259 [Halanaerobium saccharolyticum]TDX59932.1 hypothetical protein C7956_11117 [Halanaerobium saccharolyticum]